MAGRSSGSKRFASLGPSATRGRLAILAAFRATMPVIVFVALSVFPEPIPHDRVATLLGAQIAFGFASVMIAARQRVATTSMIVWASIVTDILVIGALVHVTGGPGGPLTFLFALEAIAVSVIFAASAGVRVFGAGLAALAVLEVMRPASAPPRFTDVTGTLLVTAIAVALIAFNQREARRRELELAAIRRIALDIQDSLALEEILGDLCRGVVNDLRFSAAAVLLRDRDSTDLVCAASCGIHGVTAARIPLRGALAAAITSGQIVIVSGDKARADGEVSALLGPRGYIAVPIGSEGVLVVTRVARRGSFVRMRGQGRVRANELEPLMSLAQQASLTVANARLHAHVAAMAVTDPLTELANHREFQRVLHHESERQRRYTSAAGHHMSVLLIDIDHFKSVNDRFGHPAGDEVLRVVARALRTAVRSFDVVARYGGEEFAVVLPETDEEGAHEVAERARRAVAALDLVAHGKRVKVTISIGAATAPEDGMTPAQLVSAADTALYRSKATGRNRVTHAVALGRRVPSITRRRGRRSA
ncbi:MAG: diguanylate cyclase [Actinomycetota bacterium]|nr:sensor domain-containing diguanylate cyclase [Actinomycetota bacterium]